MKHARGNPDVKRVLMIAFHYPPQHGSSGVQRTLAFSRYLQGFGWLPTVLTAHPRAHASTSDAQMPDIPATVQVHRAPALDAARHLSLRGRYALASALPDRWSSWWLGAVPVALRIIWRERPALIWSTYPIPTAHWIGYTLTRLTGLPWIADFRDPMTDPSYPGNPRVRRAHEWLERKAVRHAAMLVFSTPGAAVDYRQRFAELDPGRVAVIENGYDEANFARAEQALASRMPGTNAGSQDAQAEAPAHGDGPLVLLHSGIVYPSERDPRPLFEALAALQADGLVSARRLRIVLRAAVHETYLQELIDQHGIGGIVSLAPAIPYQQALQEMLHADALLVLQAANCNSQIPAKLYEYLRARRPILALTDADGDTARMLRESGIDAADIVALDSSAAIHAALPDFLERLERGATRLPSDDAVLAASRQARTRELARLFNHVLQPDPVWPDLARLDQE